MNSIRHIRYRTAPARFSETQFTGFLLVQERDAELEEILKHKWIESEKEGRDIGLERAEMDWRLRHASDWHRWRRKTKRCVLVSSA